LNQIKQNAYDVSLKGYDIYTGYGMPALYHVLSSSVGSSTTTTTTTASKVPTLGVLALPFASFFKKRRKK
jgi:hypothetical protein